MPPQHRVEVIVEIPKGSRNKYEMDHVTGELWLDRHLFTATTYPADYGFIRDTLGGDGHLWARPVGVFRMHDEAGDDAKILCVLADDPRWASIDDIDDVDHHLINEIRHFFEIYKDLEPGKSAEIGEWAGRDAAFVEIETARQRHVDHPH